MSYSSKSGSRRNLGGKVSKNVNQKKAKTKKLRAGPKYLREETAEPTLQEVVGKTLVSIERLGNQIFALSPFSQYYNDWLVNLQQVISEFEAFSDGISDELFTKEYKQAFLDIQTSLTERCMQETVLSDAEKSLYAANHDLRIVEVDYAEKNQALNSKRNNDIHRLINQVKALEEELSSQEKLKFGFFQFDAKKTAAKKFEQTQHKLAEVKGQLEEAQRDFKVEQDNLHETYVAKKQELSAKLDTLRKEIEQLEVDPSVEDRRSVCTRLSKLINEWSERLSANTSN
jgi:chromosome segregation ATPase